MIRARVLPLAEARSLSPAARDTFCTPGLLTPAGELGGENCGGRLNRSAVESPVTDPPPAGSVSRAIATEHPTSRFRSIAYLVAVRVSTASRTWRMTYPPPPPPVARLRDRPRAYSPSRCGWTGEGKKGDDNWTSNPPPCRGRRGRPPSSGSKAQGDVSHARGARPGPRRPSIRDPRTARRQNRGPRGERDPVIRSRWQQIGESSRGNRRPSAGSSVKRREEPPSFRLARTMRSFGHR